MFNALILLFLAIIGLFLSFYTYGYFMAKDVFKLSNHRRTPAHNFNDGCDFVPSPKGMVFGHHFTSIAGTGPIVGPAIGVIWGWLPALIWVFFGSIFMGAVHDFGSLVVSLRHKGRSIFDLVDVYVSRRVQLLVFTIVCFALWIVIAIFGLVIAIIFNLFPEAVIPVWLEIPIAIAFGYFVRQYPSHFWILCGSAIALMILTVIVGHFVPVTMPNIFSIPATGLWTLLLLIYAAIASKLPVQYLLQPRDYLNAWQLYIALGLLFLGAIITGISGDLVMVAPAVVFQPLGAPSMLPFLFITIACGAISGFHSLVASGTTSKQLNKESDALSIGYGSMLVEGALAVIIIIACCAGIGIGYPQNGTELFGVQAWQAHYESWGASAGLASKLEAVVVGSANMLASLGIPTSLGAVIMGVFIASFAGTTLDTSTRLQRYVIREISVRYNLNVSILKATFIAVVSAAILAFSAGFSGKGALLLWPLFGQLNQLLAAIGLGVISLYLIYKRSVYSILVLLPFVFMVSVSLWAGIENQFQFFVNQQWVLLVMNGLILSISTLVFYQFIYSMIRIKSGRVCPNTLNNY
jgi:carbon starvation protein